ncbi:MAG: hypothetical protein JWM80_4067 [Cyanobacteria bacterium RYN_339]|nr:hypothetical protein [Cyanobacteria bacterium RYN_339]
MSEKRRAMPRPAIKAIAASGIFCGFMTCFLVYFAWRMGFSPAFVVLNAVTAVLMFVGSAWMLAQLRRA